MLRREIANQSRTDHIPGYSRWIFLLVSALVFAIYVRGDGVAATSDALSGKTSGTALRQPTEREIEEWIRSRATTSKALRDKLEEVNESYEIVFVPGILGSQLQIGSFTYGKDPIEARKLVFAPAQVTRAATLNEFKAQIARVFQKNVDIYGQGLNDAQSANGGRPLVEFAYDWRDDLDKLAADFDSFLQAQLPKKKFVIVAHSMGGVIAWHWKNKFNKQHKRDLIALVALGSPLQGSCEPARMLVEGYGPPDQSSSFEKWATHLVFGKAHPAVLTFPSVFALLPVYDERQPCLRIRRGTKTIPLDHHEVGSWMGRSGGDYQLPVDFAARAGLDTRAYAEQVTAAIKAGRAFRQAFDSEPYDDQIYLLYADSHKLSSNTVVEPKGQKWLARVDSGQEAGDGRVSRDSAMNLGNFDARRGAAVTLERDHGALLADPRFSSFLRDNIKRLISQAKHAEILAFAQKQSSLKDELRSRGWLADASLKVTSLDRIPAISSAIKTNAEYNYELLASNKANPQFSGIAFDGTDPASVMIAAGNKLYDAGDAPTAAALYSAAMVSAPDKVGIIPLKRVGDLHLAQGRPSEAVAYLSLANEAASQPGVSISDRRSLGEIYKNLGTALERAGSVEPAIKSYRAAVQHGNVDAKERVEALERETIQRPRPSQKSSDEVPSSTPAQESTIPPPRSDPKSLSTPEPIRGQELAPNRLSPQPPIRGQELPPNRLSPQPPIRGQEVIPNRLSPQPPIRGQEVIPNRLSPQAPIRGQEVIPNRVSPQAPIRGQEVIPNRLSPQAPIRGQEAIPNRLSPQEPIRGQETIPNRLSPQAPIRDQEVIPNRLQR